MKKINKILILVLIGVIVIFNCINAGALSYDKYYEQLTLTRYEISDYISISINKMGNTIVINSTCLKSFDKIYAKIYLQKRDSNGWKDVVSWEKEVKNDILIANNTWNVKSGKYRAKLVVTVSRKGSQETIKKISDVVTV